MIELPYPGLRAFEPGETHIFFGRESQADELLGRLTNTRFLAVTGPSGCGKSSLVNTGLIASLEIGLLGKAGERWQVVRMRPGSEPIHNLATELVSSGVLKSAIDGGTASSSEEGFTRWVQNTIERGPFGLKEVLDVNPLPTKSNLLIVVDQFEEVFRYRRKISQQEADAFVALLLRSAKIAEYPVYVVITMRSDFLGECTVFPGLPEAINYGQFLTPRLTREEIQSAIEGPAEVYGGSVDATLSNRLLNAVGSSDDQLPILQHALMRIWTLAVEKAEGASVMQLGDGDSAPADLNMDLYLEAGGLDSALSNHTDEAFRELGAEGKSIACIMFCALTDRAINGRYIRRPVSIQDVAKVAKVPHESVIAVADRFRRPDRCFLVPSEVDLPMLCPESMLDISHESLIRQWKRLARWVEDEADAARNYQRLEDSALRWKHDQTDLLGSIELDRLLQWKSDWSPTKVWADRYGGHFPLAMKFLDLSKQARDRTLQKLEQRRADIEDLRLGRATAKLQRQRLFWMKSGMAVAIGLGIIAVIGWTHSFTESESARQATLAKKAQLLSYDASSRNLHAKALLMRLASYRAGKDAEPIEANGVLLKGLLDYKRIKKIVRGKEGSIDAVGFNSQSKHIALAGKARASSSATDDSEKFRRGAIVILDAENGEEITRLDQFGEGVTSVSFSGDGEYLAGGSWDGQIRVWDATTWEELFSPIDAQADVLKVVIDKLPDGSRFVMSSGQQSDYRKLDKAMIWRLESGELADEGFQLSGLPEVINIAYASDKGYAVLLAPTEQGYVASAQIWDVENDQAISAIFEFPVCEKCAKTVKDETSKDKLHSMPVAISRNGKRLATISGEMPGEFHIRIWNLEQPDKPLAIAKLIGHEDRILDMQFHDENRLASSSRNGEVLLWDVSDQALERTAVLSRVDRLPTVLPLTRLQAQIDWVRGLAFYDGGNFLVSISGSDSIFWSVGDSDIISNSMRIGESEVWSLARDSKRLVAGGESGKIFLWNLTESSVPQLIEQDVSKTGITALALNESPDILVASDVKDRIRVWDDISLQQDLYNPSHEWSTGWDVRGVALSADARYLAISGLNGELSVRERRRDRTWKPIFRRGKESGSNDWRVTGWGDNLAFSDDSEWLFFGVEELLDREAKLRSFSIRAIEMSKAQDSDYKPLKNDGDIGQIISLSYAENCGSEAMPPCLVSAGVDNSIQIWRKSSEGTWYVDNVLSGHQNRINSVSISPDGKAIASGSRDRSLRLWDITSGRETAAFTDHSDYVNRVQFSSDGKTLYSASDDGSVVGRNVDFARYEALVCEMVDRNLTCDEWRELETEKLEYLQLCPGPNRDPVLRACGAK